MPKIRSFRFGSLAVVCLWLATLSISTAKTEAPLDLKSFPRQFFPGLDKQSPEKIYLEGLMRLYPGRVLDEAPEAEVQATTREALVESLPRGISYLRIYDMEGAMTALDEHSKDPVLILDLRYFYGDSKAALTLLGYFQKGSNVHIADPMASIGYFDPIAPKNEAIIRDDSPPVIVLTNHRTRGYIEPALQGLQLEGAIMTVGTRTAGATGRYSPVPGIEGFWVIGWEYALAEPKGPSLLGIGLDPEIPVSVSPEDDFTGYQLLETGYSARTILQAELPALTPKDTANEDTEQEQAVDPILQRAVEIVVALDLLGKLPQR